MDCRVGRRNPADLFAVMHLQGERQILFAKPQPDPAGGAQFTKPGEHGAQCSDDGFVGVQPARLCNMNLSPCQDVSLYRQERSTTGSVRTSSTAARDRKLAELKEQLTAKTRQTIFLRQLGCRDVAANIATMTC